ASAILSDTIPCERLRIDEGELDNEDNSSQLNEEKSEEKTPVANNLKQQNQFTETLVTAKA
ncbi:MAG: hypothetical protein WA896_19040, partial [Spirulinaceae cyanobacterium]